VSEVPWWYATTAHAFAVLLSVWVGLHYRDGEWFALYSAAAVASAVLPARRIGGAFALLIGLGVAGAGAYLMRDARHAIVLADIFSGRGGLVTPAREALVLVVTTMWLLAASPLRFRWA
jgi:hypothetical protein